MLRLAELQQAGRNHYTNIYNSNYTEMANSVWYCRTSRCYQMLSYLGANIEAKMTRHTPHILINPPAETWLLPSLSVCHHWRRRCLNRFSSFSTSWRLFLCSSFQAPPHLNAQRGNTREAAENNRLFLLLSRFSALRSHCFHENFTHLAK